MDQNMRISMNIEAAPGALDRHTALRQRVAVLCHVIRWVAVAWIGWALVIIVMKWTDRSALADSWGRFLKLDLAQLPWTHYASAFAVVLADWAVAAMVVFFFWRLFGHYLQGRIFTREAVDEMRWLGWVGVAAVVMDFIARPLVRFFLAMHLGNSAQPLGFWIEPNDLLHLLMALFIVVLAHIFKAGVEIADDHRQIV
jgi:hypothetical protein